MKYFSFGRLFVLSTIFLCGFITPGYSLDVTLEWNAKTESNLLGYRIYYDTGSGPPYNGTRTVEDSSPIDVAKEDVEIGNLARYTLTGLSESETYYFAVTAYNTEGLESGYSNEASTGNSLPTAAIALESGDHQTGTVGQALAEPFVVTVTDQDGNPVAGVAVTFTVASGEGTLTNSQPQMTDANGRAQTVLTLGPAATTANNIVEATAAGFSGFPVIFTAGARPGPLVTLTITPDSKTLAADETHQFTVTGKDSYGNTVTALGTLTWSVNGGIGIIDSNGLFEASTVSTGTVTVTSSPGSISATSAAITVTPVPLATLTVSPDTVNLTADNTQQFTVTGKDSDGNAVTELGTLSWSVNGDIGTIDSNGLFNATNIGVGTVTVSSSLGSLSGTSATITVTPGILATLTISPDTATLAADQTRQFTVAGKDSDGNAVTELGTLSCSVNGDIGTIDNNGLFNAATVGTGSVTVTSSLNSISDTTAAITVTPGVLAALSVSPDTTTLTADDTQQFSVTGKDSDGNAVTELGALNWSVNGGIGTIDNNGLFNAATVGAGSVTITSSFLSISATSATINVTPGELAAFTMSPDTAIIGADNVQLFMVTGKDSDGNQMTELGELSWRVNGGIGTISSIDNYGLLSATTLGTGTITVTSDLGPAYTTGTITVAPGDHPVLTLTPGTATLTANSSFQFTVTGKYLDGNQLTELGTLSWSVNGDIGTVDSNGLFNATNIGVGTVTVSSSLGSISDTSAIITVTPGIPATLTVSPDTATLTADQTQQFTVTGKDSDGNAVTELGTLSWSVDGDIGTIDNNGLFNAATVGTGSVAVTSSLSSISDTTAAITVAPGALAALTVSPDTAALTANSSIQFTVTGKDLDSNQLTELGTLSWSVNGDIGTVDSNGLFNATNPGVGTVAVTSSLGGISDTSAIITVTPGTPATLTVSPDTATLTADQTQQFTVIGKDLEGNAVTDLGTLSWSVAGDIGTIDNNGRFHATTVGSGTVKVTSSLGSITDTNDTITVTPGILATLTVSPDAATLTADQTEQFTVIGKDSDGNAVTDLGTLSWSVTGDLGTIDNNGRFHATTVGSGTVKVTSSLGSISDTNDAITVTPGILAALTVSPDTVTLTADQTQQFTVTGKDSDDNAVTELGTLAWSLNGDIGTIDNSGLFNAGDAGDGTVTVSSDLGPSETTGDITVTAGVLATLSVSPDMATLTADDTHEFTVTGQDSDGNPVSEMSILRWSVSGGIGVINDQAFFYLEKGEHTLVVKQREDGTKIDRLLITNDAKYIPAGLGEQIVSESVKIWIEAEAGFIQSPMTIVEDGSVSSGRYIWIPEGMGSKSAPSPDAGYAEYMFEVPVAGEYVISGRVSAGDLGSDSFYVSVDGTEYVLWDTQVSDIWVWEPVADRKHHKALFHGITEGTGTVTVTSALGASETTGGITVTPGVLATLIVSPDVAAFTADDSRQFTVTGQDSDGNPVSELGTLSWSVSGGIGTIDSKGLFNATSLGVGTVQVTSSLGSLSGTSATITVTPGILATLSVSPDTAALTADQTRQLTVTGKDSDGNAVTELGMLSWSVDGDIGTIDNDGLFNAATVGTGSVTVTSSPSGISDTTAAITVTPGVLDALSVSPDKTTLTADDTRRFTVTGKDSDGNALTELGILSWSVNGGIGTIDSIGLFSATTVGTGAVAVASDLGPSETTGDITVTPGALATLSISPDMAALTADDTRQFTVTGKDSDGNPVTELGTLSWSVTGDIGTFVGNGLFEASTIGSGTVKVTSSFGSISDTSDTITVTPGVLATLSVSSDTTTLTADQTQQFTVAGKDSDGNAVTELGTLSWSVDGDIGTIDNNGLFNAATVGTGSVTITSSPSSISDTTAAITVTPGVLATLTVSPETATLTADQTQQFTVSGKDSDGNAVTELGTLSWSVDGVIGAIDSTGLFSATSVGTGAVTVASDLEPSETTGAITVTPGVLAALSVSPDMAVLTADDTRQFTVTGQDSDGNPVTELGMLSWSVTGGIGTIDENGRFHATTVGSGSISVISSVNGVQDTSEMITVMKDDDNDGMPDVWEEANGLDPYSNDAAGDPDHDTLDNEQEYFHGTDPWQTDSDRDGIGDGTEVSMTTDPLDPDRRPAIALTTSGMRVTDVTPVSFSLVWVTNQTAGCLANVYTDPQGSDLVKTLSITDESSAHPPAADNGVMKVKISGVSPDTTYYFRIITAGSEAVLVEPANGDLPGVHTEVGNLPVNNDLIAHRTLQSDGTPAAGALMVAEVEGASYPITGWVGDGVPNPWALLNLNNVYNLEDHKNMELVGGEAITLESIGGSMGCRRLNTTVPPEESGEIRTLDPAPQDAQCILDSTPPVIDTDQLHPAAGALVNYNTPLITTSYFDEFSRIYPESVRLLVDGTEVSDQAMVNPGNIEYTPTSPLSDGNHTVTIYVADQWGYTADPVTWTFTVDTTAPAITISTPQNGESLYPALQTVRWTLEGENPANLILTVNGSSETLAPNATETTVELREGVNTIELSVLDQAGNFTNAAIQVTFDGDSDSDGDGIIDHYDPDDDNDLMPDSWEAANGLDPLDPFDARLDHDGDGHANLSEYSAGSDPQDSESYPTVTLEVDHVMVTDVTSGGFSVIWQTGEPSTCSLEVYDEAGDLLSNLDIVSESRLYPPAEDIGVMKVTVKGLEADKIYNFQTVTIAKASGRVLFTPVYPQVFEVVTESADAVVVNDLIEQRIFDENGDAPEGALLAASVTGGDYPVTAWVGQDIASPWARVDLNRIYSELTHENLQLLGGEELTLWSFGGQLGNYVNIQKIASPTGAERVALPDAAYLSRDTGFSLDLNRDLNFFGIPVYTETPFSAHSLLVYLEDQAAGDSEVVESIKRYNRQTGNWEMVSWFMGMPAGPDFPIKPGEAYFIYLKEAVNSVWFEGIALGTATDLLPGMNLVCLPAAGDGFTYTSYEMLQDLGDENQAAYIERYNPTAGWQSTAWSLGSPAMEEYTTRAGEGYSIYMNQEKLDWRAY